jgi:hypothetical protein
MSTSSNKPACAGQASSTWRIFRDRDEWIEQVLACDLTATAKIVATRIALHHNIETGRCDPSMIGLVKRTHTSDSTVRRAIKELEDAGLLAVDRTSGRYRNSYLLLAPTLPPMEGLTLPSVTGLNPTAHDRVETSNPTAGGGQPYQNEVPNPTTVDRQTANIKQRKKQRRESDSPQLQPVLVREDGRREVGTPSTHPDSTCAGFETWWRQYPKRVAKAAALKAYRTVLTKELTTPDELLAGAMRYAADREGQDPRYTKHPATWLNGGCWADEAAMAIISTIDEAGNVLDWQQPHDRTPVNPHAARRDAAIVKMIADGIL